MTTERYTARLVLKGHIIDSMMLPQIMDLVMDVGGNFTIEELTVGQHKTDTSLCRMEVVATSPEQLDRIVRQARALGATVESEQPAHLEKVTKEGVFPEGFYSTSNLQTEVLLDGRWVLVEDIEMDCAIAVDTKAGRARCIVFQGANPGMDVVVGHQGVRVTPLERSRQTEIFTFMASEVSAEKPKKVLIGAIAEEMKQIRKADGRIVVVAGPAVVHTGAGRYLSRLIELGFVQVLFAGNALAVHDVESALFGTALGVNVESGLAIEHGHEHHMRAINRVRAAGGLRQMVESGQLTSGVMKSAIDHGIDYVLAGSVRDDGPLPDVITDMVEAQKRMRASLHGVRMAIMLSTMLHSIATGNMLPAWVRTVCVDINPAVVTKLADRGSWQSIGLVTDVESFLRELALVIETGAHG
ncbi:MAG TPA: TIGR00300 family protein [Candidatus Dormibacteraeota bacterium]|jgi:lysine-ketoglutarate reductase/saccharopine dehydrogenase-like protein (TIGR00300 family)|nr:TIGR00300 family protein [Candidatus Dormibacteraeota bacterium]